MVASNSLQINKVNETGLTLKEAFQLATLGGSQGKKKILLCAHRKLQLSLIICLPVFMGDSQVFWSRVKSNW